jgi:hypothetical protein
VYYQDSSYGEPTLTAKDWLSGIDDPGIQNISATVTITGLSQTVTIVDPTPEKIQQKYAEGYITIESGSISSTTKGTMNAGFTITDGVVTVVVPAGTEITPTQGGQMDLAQFTTQDISQQVKESDSHVIAAAGKIGIINQRLTFSHPVTVTLEIPSAFDDQTLEVRYRNEGESQWQHETFCTVMNNQCSFSTNHATDFAAGPGPLSVSETTDVNLHLDATLSIACDDSVTMGTIAGTGQSALATNSASCNILTNNSNGYKLDWQASSAFMNSGVPRNDTIAGFTPISSNVPEFWTINSTDSEWGGKLSHTSTTYDLSKWGSEDTYTAGKWLNVATSPYTVIQRTSETSHTGDTETILFGAEVGSSKIQPNGDYSVSVTMTATTL